MKRKFLCVKSYMGGKYLTKRKIYEMDENGFVFDDGWKFKNFNYETNSFDNGLKISDLLKEITNKENNKMKSIYITIDGKKTHIVLKDNGKVVKHADVSLYYKDKYDFETGVRESIDKLFGKVEKKDEMGYKEVKRTAKVGEWVKVVNADNVPRTNGKDDYKNGDILKIVNEDCLDRVCYVCYSNSYPAEDGKDKLLHSSEYVVFEGYKPEEANKSKSLSDYTVDELLAEVKRRMED